VAGFAESVSLVTLSELGDKTQLLAIVLAARFQKPWAVFWGIVVATLANHALAVMGGAWLAAMIPRQWLLAGLGVTFIGFAFWLLVPDELSEEEQKSRHERDARAGRHTSRFVRDFWRPFSVTAFVFFLAEMGDKTQLATAALGARFPGSPGLVLFGTTCGMIIADGLSVWFGKEIAEKIPMGWMRRCAAVIMAGFGVVTLTLI
jgi:putative Ca2+/H+ antiporter (TMEM165/GDT1 family)